MFKEVDGRLVRVPDDDSITPALLETRGIMQKFLNAISADTPQNRELRRQYLESKIEAQSSMDWYQDWKP